MKNSTFIYQPIITQNKVQIDALCEQYGVDKLFVFGSVTNSKLFRDDSDIDIIIQIDESKFLPEDLGETLFNLNDEFEKLFQRPVDLIRDRPFRNQIFRKNIDRSKILVYDRTQ
jgi:uncharacterized protein